MLAFNFLVPTSRWLQTEWFLTNFERPDTWTANSSDGDLRPPIDRKLDKDLEHYLAGGDGRKTPPGPH